MAVEKIVRLENCEYELINDYKNAFDLSLVKERYTDYFDSFDYIFGDFSYDKVRLKGFYDKNSPQVSEINNIENLENYIKNYCAYDCRYFLLKKIKKVNKNSWIIYKIW